jgi:hypothetical protein
MTHCDALPNRGPLRARMGPLWKMRHVRHVRHLEALRLWWRRVASGLQGQISLGMEVARIGKQAAEHEGVFLPQGGPPYLRLFGG